MTAPLLTTRDRLAAELHLSLKHCEHFQWIADTGRPWCEFTADALLASGAVVAVAVATLAGDEALVECVARSLAQLEPDQEWPTNDALGGGLTGTRDDEYRDALSDDAREVLAALANELGSA